jgi:RNA polymerase sigma-70 factor, ECF subfamily
VELLRKPTVSRVKAELPGRQRQANLIEWIAKGDAAAFRQFYDATNGLLFGLLLRILGHTQTAEVVLSELYEEVRQKAARFGSKNERPLTWLIFIAHRRAIEALCCKLASQSQIRTSINITEQRRLIREAMDSIPDLQQEMVEMAFFDGMTNLEIAKEVGRSPEKVEADLRHAMLRLFQLFSTIGFSPLNPTATRQT